MSRKNQSCSRCWSFGRRYVAHLLSCLSQSAPWQQSTAAPLWRRWRRRYDGRWRAPLRRHRCRSQRHARQSRTVHPDGNYEYETNGIREPLPILITQPNPSLKALCPKGAPWIRTKPLNTASCKKFDKPTACPSAPPQSPSPL